MANERTKVPTFRCQVCGKVFRSMVINGVTYAIRDEHFAIQTIEKEVPSDKKPEGVIKGSCPRIV